MGCRKTIIAKETFDQVYEVLDGVMHSASLLV